MTKKSYGRKQRDNARKQPQAFDFAMHKAQQLESLVTNLELLKNNIYGQTQIDIILHYMSTGKSEAEAVELSLNLIDITNDINMKRIQAKKKEIEDQMKAANPLVSESPDTQKNEPLTPAVAEESAQQ